MSETHHSDSRGGSGPGTWRSLCVCVYPARKEYPSTSHEETKPPDGDTCLQPHTQHSTAYYYYYYFVRVVKCTHPYPEVGTLCTHSPAASGGGLCG